METKQNTRKEGSKNKEKKKNITDVTVCTTIIIIITGDSKTCTDGNSNHTMENNHFSCINIYAYQGKGAED